MLILKDLIAQGHVRACYFHPTHTDLCVKVALHPKHNYLLKKEIKNNARFQKTIAQYVPRYHELVETDKGLGLVLDLICDDNHCRSPDFRHIWLKRLVTPELIQQFDDFFTKIIKHRLWFYDFNTENFLIRTHNQKQQLIFVDTKSLNRNNSWSTLKLEYIFPCIAKYRVLRRIRRFYADFRFPLPDQFK